MTEVSAAHRTTADEPAGVLAGRVFTSPDNIFPFEDYSDFLLELLNRLSAGIGRLITIGHRESWVQTAVIEATVECDECFGSTPFRMPRMEQLAERLGGNELLWIANPNPISGACCSLADLATLAAAVPEGLLIIDEGLADFYGITGLPLTKEYENVVILRSMSLGFGERSPRSGFAIADATGFGRLREHYNAGVFHSMIYKMIDSETLSLRLKLIRDEAVRLAACLRLQRLETHLSDTGSLLVRVAEPDEVVSQMARQNIRVESLSDHQGLSEFIRYRIGTLADNDRFLNSLLGVPLERLHPERRSGVQLKLRRAGESAVSRVVRGPVPLRGRMALGSAIVQEDSFE